MDGSGVLQHVGYVDTLKVTTSICLTYTLLVSGVRIYLRNRQYGVDDLFVVVATFVTLIHFCTSYAALSYGMGKSDIDLPASLTSLNDSVISSVVTFIFALYTAKITALLFLLRIANLKKTRILYYVCIAGTAVFGIASTLVVTIDCPTSSGYYWNFTGSQPQCQTQFVRWQVMTILDVVSEVILLALPVHLVWTLQMPMSRKCTIVATFWTRFPTIGLSIVREHYIKRLTQSSEDKGLCSTIVLILMQVELTYALVSCTIATSKSFTDSFNTGWGMGPIRGAAESYNMSTFGTNGSKNGTRKGDTTDMDRSFTSAMPSPMPEIGSKRGSMQPLPHRKTPSANGLVQDASLRLRPDFDGKTQTMIHSSPRHWSDEGSLSSEPDDSAIMRQTEYSISHDETPILRPSSEARFEGFTV